jgi:hypothetical protein
MAAPSKVGKECCGSKKALDAKIIQKALDESRISSANASKTAPTAEPPLDPAATVS